MSKIRIGLIKEGKIPLDRRVALTPFQVRQVQESFPTVQVVAQASDIRCFPDEEYEQEGIEVVHSLENCDILLGVKEVPIPQLLVGKTYFFFSHTIKKQTYNRELLQEILRKKIRLIDYETLTDVSGKRVIAFGRWAGIVGAYNGIWTYGKRYNLFHLRRARDCFDLEDLKTEFIKVKLPPIKIVLTGGGRVAKGAMEVLLGIGVRQVTPRDFLLEKFDFPVFTQLNSRDYHTRKEGGEFSRNEFYRLPEKYEGDFLKFTRVADLLIASAYWDPHAPVLFKRGDVLRDDFKLKIIADITCDIEGSIPTTKKPSTIDDPIYDYNPSDDEVEKALCDEGNITVMAVDNLPCELPRDASENFGEQLIRNILPHLLNGDPEHVIQRATITEHGNLTERYEYLQDYVSEKFS